MILHAALFVLLQPVVVDGDTIRDNAAWGRQAFRLAGITAPERGQAGYHEASVAMSLLLAQGPVTCTVVGPPSFDRQVVDCTLPDGRDLACAMLGTGLAVLSHAYAKPEQEACLP